jgi:sulfur carrier protein
MKKITIKINNQLISVSGTDSLANLLSTTTLPAVFAIAVNGKFLPKAQYQNYPLKDNDVVAIISPMQGG